MACPSGWTSVREELLGRADVTGFSGVHWQRRGRSGGQGQREEPAEDQLEVRAQPGLTWTSHLCLSLSPEVPGGQLGTGVYVCLGGWWGW